jgi:hypothetical protein
VHTYWKVVHGVRRTVMTVRKEHDGAVVFLHNEATIEPTRLTSHFIVKFEHDGRIAVKYLASLSSLV